MLDPDAAPDGIARVARMDEAARRPLLLVLKSLGDLVIAHAKERFRAGELERLKGRYREPEWAVEDLRRGHRSELSELLHLICAEFPGLSERLASIEDRLRRVEETAAGDAAETASDAANVEQTGGG